MVSWLIPSQSPAPPRKGFTIVSGLSLGIGTGAFKQIIRGAETAIASGSGKGGAGRNMYAETNREREALLASVRNSVWNREDDPALISVGVKNEIEHDFSQGFVVGLSSHQSLTLTLLP